MMNSQYQYDEDYPPNAYYKNPTNRNGIQNPSPNDLTNPLAYYQGALYNGTSYGPASQMSFERFGSPAASGVSSLLAANPQLYFQTPSISGKSTF